MEKSLNGNGASASLDKRVAAALADQNADKEELTALVQEATTAIKSAEETIRVESERELELENDDPDKSADLIKKAQRTIARLQKAVPELHQRIQKIQTEEYAENWHDYLDHLETERDALAQELTTLYPTFVQNITDLYARIDAVDSRISQLEMAAPPGEHRRLLGVELVARKLDSFDRYNVPLRQNLKLPHPNETCEIIFPPQQNYGLMALNAMQPALQSIIQKDAVACNSDWSAAQKVESDRIRDEAKKRDEELKQQKLKERDEYFAKLREADRGARGGVK